MVKNGMYLEAKGFVAIRGVGGAAGGGCTHPALAVLADEDSGEVLQLDLEFMSNGSKKKY